MSDEDQDHYTDEDIKKLLLDSLKLKIQENRSLPQKVKMNQAIIATLGEFLSCFKLIGYDIEGNPVNLTISKTKMDSSALEHAFIQEFTEYMGGKGVINDE